VAIWRVTLAVTAGLFVAGCSASSTTANTTKPLGSPTTEYQLQRGVPGHHLTAAPTEATTTPATLPCASGTVSVPWQPSQYETSVCVTVGSTLILTGGDAMSGGTWPGPPTFSNAGTLSLTSSSASGTTFTANLRAIRAGSATVTVPFVAGSPVCDPTPCTPVPGRPMVWQVTVAA
jgi:hypothetical protein